MMKLLKLTDLWLNRRKKAIRIIQNDGKWPIPIDADLTVNTNEIYYSRLPKYVKSSELNVQAEKFFVKNDEYLNDIPLFNTAEVCNVIMTSPNGRSCGSDGL